MSVVVCKHLAVSRHVGFSNVYYVCKGCGERWTVRLIAGKEPPAGRPR